MPNELVLPAPLPKQKLFLQDRHKFCVFGGARGGGKSMAIDLKTVLTGFKYPGFRSTVIRRTYPELKDNHVEPMKALLRCGQPDALATYNASEKDMKLPNGSVIRYRFCDNENALSKIQGQETDFLFIDEATNFPEEWLKKMYACVRGTNGFPKRIYLTCNPGGVSHGYIRRIIEGRFEEGEDPNDYAFYQSLVTDNLVLMREQPDYIKQLESLPPSLKEAWLNGRWDVFEGAYFEEFRLSPDPQKCHEAGISTEEALEQHRWTHVIKPFEIDPNWKIFRSYDFGYGKPFSVGWWALDYNDVAYRILELYGCKKNQPNKGLDWSPSQQMEKIAEIEREHPWLKGKFIQGVADPAIWEGSHGISIVEEADKRGIFFEKGQNERIAGWVQIRERLKFDSNGFARMYFFDNCKAIIRTMPLMMYDEHKVEDLDSDLEDHACDEVRYFCMMRKCEPRLITKEYRPLIDPLEQFKTGNINQIQAYMNRR